VLEGVVPNVDADLGTEVCLDHQKPAPSVRVVGVGYLRQGRASRAVALDLVETAECARVCNQLLDPVRNCCRREQAWPRRRGVRIRFQPDDVGPEVETHLSSENGKVAEYVLLVMISIDGNHERQAPADELVQAEILEMAAITQVPALG